MKWNVRSVDHLHDRWEILFDGRRAGWVNWVRALRHPELTKRRIIDGLNDRFGAAQPPRTWAFGPETAPRCWDLCHNGTTVGEIAWETVPHPDPEVWQDRILAGLNWVAGQRSITAPEPAAPALRRAS